MTTPRRLAREMNDENHETPDLLGLLGQADPVDPTTLPTSADPAARSMIDRVVADTASLAGSTGSIPDETASTGLASVIDLESAAGDPADAPLVTTATNRIERPVPKPSLRTNQDSEPN